MEREVRQQIEEMPGLLRQIAAELPSAQIRQRPGGGELSFVEHAWHLADLEREGYGVRIRRLLGEDNPELADFPGGRIAKEREYRICDLEPALAIFEQTRRRNVERLAAVGAAGLARSGRQEGVGVITLGQVPGMMRDHDCGHVQELLELLEEAAPQLPVLERLRAYLAEVCPNDTLVMA